MGRANGAPASAPRRANGRDRSPAIAEHGIIGDTRTAALVATDGTVDSLCWPAFDGPSLFARLLDGGGADGEGHAGYFAIAPERAHDGTDGEPDDGDARRQQIYLPDTNVLITRFLSGHCVVEVTDFMPVDGPQRLVRLVACLRGQARIAVRCAPRFDYARADHAARAVTANGLGGAVEGVAFEATGGASLRLLASVPQRIEGGDATASFDLGKGERAAFMLDAPERVDAHDMADDPVAHALHLFEKTVRYWRGWVGRSHYRGRSREIVLRSALALKLMTSGEHGSIVAAPTFGLPETLGGARNWDYRYAWIRDAAFTAYALVKLGFTDEITAFLRWAEARLRENGDGSLQIMYGLDGRRTLSEERLDHFGGYAGSTPVRIGNAAYSQLQLDSYGALMDAVYLAVKYAEPISYDAWLAVTRTVDWVCEHWRREDEGIWEFRGGRRHFLSSRLMCWVAVDRALRMAQKYSLPGPVARWQDARNAIHHSVFADFWNGERGAFVQSKGSTALDAACLLMPLVKFISPTDPRWLSTLDAVGRELADDALVRRYDAEGEPRHRRAGGRRGHLHHLLVLVRRMPRAGGASG